MNLVFSKKIFQFCVRFQESQELFLGMILTTTPKPGLSLVRSGYGVIFPLNSGVCYLWFCQSPIYLKFVCQSCSFLTLELVILARNCGVHLKFGTLVNLWITAIYSIIYASEIDGKEITAGERKWEASLNRKLNSDLFTFLNWKSDLRSKSYGNLKFLDSIIP